MTKEQKEILLKLKAYISANFLDLSDTSETEMECGTCGSFEAVEGTEGMTMNKISDVIDEFIKTGGFK